jgi:hypothetical protein
MNCEGAGVGGLWCGLFVSCVTLCVRVFTWHPECLAASPATRWTLAPQRQRPGGQPWGLFASNRLRQQQARNSVSKWDQVAAVREACTAVHTEGVCSRFRH